MNLPSISVVVPNFNQAPFLPKALDSIVSQNYPKLELIVIDGGSSDESAEIIKDRSAEIAYWTSERDKGHYDAVNKGFAHSTGEVLAFLNSDDMLFPGSLHLVGEIFAGHPDVRWITSLNPALWDAAGHCFSVLSIPGYSRQGFLDGAYGGTRRSKWYIQQESTFWRRSLWEESGGTIDQGISHAGDFDLWRRFYRHAELYGVSALIGGFRVREGQRGAEGCSYPQQAEAVLAQARKEHNWKPEALSPLLSCDALLRLPKIGGAIRRLVGYQGKRLVRSNPGSRVALWKMEEYIYV